MTRRRVDVIGPDGRPHWEVLVNGAPSPTLRAYLEAGGYTVKRPLPKPDYTYAGPMFSLADPSRSAVAAREAYERAPTQRNKLLYELLKRNGRWMSRDEVRIIAGDSGDRRARELREEGNWPIEIRQNVKNMPWEIRLNLDPLLYNKMRTALFGDED